MKKNISINISGVIFHIEEDGYDQLKNYLDSINTYFSTYDESKEIIADIENRIAEIFISKLNESKQVITAEDVASLIATMGNISDFEAVEEDEDKAYESSTFSGSGTDNNTRTSSPYTRGKKLYRDIKRKKLGGVAAGIALHLGVDPIWIRVGFLVMFLGLAPFIREFSGITLIAYIFLWIVLPASADLEGTEKFKKLFRDPDHRVLGGVCGGLAAYFGTDVALIRLFFVLGVLAGGFGFITYIILWIVMPEAMTITDKIQMQGEPVTLSNIEHNLKRTLDVKDEAGENALTKILLFPFRLISIIFTGVGKILGPIFILLGETVRVVFGSLLVFVPFILIIAFLVVLAVFFGAITNYDAFHMGHLPIEMVTQAIPKFSVVGAFFIAVIPLFALAMLGLSVLAKRRLFPAALGWSLAGLFIISVLATGFTATSYLYNFKHSARYREEKAINMGGKTPVLKLGLDDEDVNYTDISLSLRGYDGSDLKLVNIYKARGRNSKDALENAHSINYNVTQQDSTLIFDANYTLKAGMAFRAQDLDLVLYIPYDKEFMIAENMREILPHRFRNDDRFHNDHDYNDYEANRWVITKDGIKCITCKEDEGDELFDFDNDYNYHDNDYDHSDYDHDDDDDNDHESYSFEFDSDDDSNDDDDNAISGITKKYELRDFKGLNASGFFVINVIRGDEYKVKISGDENVIEDLDVSVKNNILNIDKHDGKAHWGNDDEKVRIDVVMPRLEEIEFNGATHSNIRNFNSDRISIRLAGASSAKLDLEVRDLELNIAGASSIHLKGKADYAKVNVAGASNVEAYDFKIRKGDFEITGPSSSKIYVTDDLKVRATGLSNVRYRGNPKMIDKVSVLSKIRREDE